MNILFTICGRAGSKGFKNKNLKEMNGVPLVYYTLAAICGYKEANPRDNILIAVNTDSSELLEILKKQKKVQFISIGRKEDLAGDSVPKVSVIQDTYQQLNSYKIDTVVDLDITSPYRRVIDIENALNEYNTKDYDVLFSVVKARRSPYFNMVEQKKDGYYKKICASSITARQQASLSYELNASIYVYNPSFLDNTIDKTILDYRCGISIMPDYLVLDIDSENDFEMMQYLHSYYCQKDDRLAAIYQSAKEMYRS